MKLKYTYMAVLVGGPAPFCLNLTFPTQKKQLCPPQSEVNITRVCITGLNSQSPRHFAWQPSAQVLQTSRSSYLSNDCSFYVSIRILAPTPLWLQKHSDECAHDFAHSPDFWHQPRLAYVICAWSWRLCGINLFILLMNAVLDISIVNKALCTVNFLWVRPNSGIVIGNITV